MTTVISHLNMDLDIPSYAGMDEMYHSLQFMALRVNFIRIGPVWDFAQFAAYLLYFQSWFYDIIDEDQK